MHTLQKFLPYYKPYRRIFFFDLFCAAMISLIDLAYPQLLRVLTNTLFRQEAAKILQVLPGIAAGLFAAYVVQALCTYYVTYRGHMMGAQMERDMRRELFERYEALSFSYYDRSNTGQLMSRLISDLFDISEMAHHGPENFFISIVKIVGAFVFLFLIHKKLALLLFVVVVVMFFVSA